MRERDIFIEALQKDGSVQRAEYLNAACGDDRLLRERVEQLLAEHERQESFFLDSPPAAVATVEQPPIERPGMQIGPYKLLQQIGEGGFGVVYMAEQTEPVRRKVALKVIKPGMDTRQVIARFEAERQALAVMDHPNIAKVLDAGTVGQVVSPHSLEMQVDNLLHAGRPYFVMELVRGVPITQYCDENSLPIRERLELFATVCQAIQHAHTKGIIHRDIKPTNVLVTRQDGQPVVKVIDFGVAKAMGQQLTDKTLFTEFAQMIGTPLYMSPEQAELSSTDIDTRSDIYSLGVLLYELLTGSTPVSKEQLKQAAFDEIRRIIREEEPPKPSTRISTAESAPSIAAQRHTEPAKLTKLVRGELDWIVMKALEKDRNRRYETASGFARDVQRYLDDEQVQACPPSAGYRLRKLARRNKAALATAGMVALVLVGGIIGTTLGMLRATKAQADAEYEAEQKDEARRDAEARKNQAETNEKQATKLAGELAHMVAMEKEARELATRREREARWNVYVARLFPMRDAWEKRDFGSLEQLLLASVPKEGEPDFRGWEWYYFEDQLRQASHRVQGGSASWCQKTGRIAIARGGGLDIWNPDTGKVERTLKTTPDYLWRVAWNPNGKVVAFASDKAVFAVDVSTTKVIGQFAVNTVHQCGLRWSPDGKKLAFASQGPVTIWDVNERREQRVIRTSKVKNLDWHPDGNRLATCHNDGSVRVWNTATGESVLTTTESGGVGDIAWNPDGKRLAIGHQFGITIRDEQGRQLISIKGNLQEGALRWSPDGVHLLSGGRTHAVGIWDSRTDENRLLQLHGKDIRDVAWSPDGKRALSGAGGTICIFDAERVSTKTIVQQIAKGPISDVKWSPGGKYISCGTEEGVVLCDGSTGKQIHLLSGRPVVSTTWDSGGETCCSLESSGKIVVWDLRTEGQVKSIRSFVVPIPPSGGKIAWSPDQKVLVIGAGAVTLWDTASWEPIEALSPYTGVGTVAWSPDSLYLATGQWDGLSVWDIRQKGRVYFRASSGLHGNSRASVAWHPEGRLISGTSDKGDIAFWRALDGQLIHVAWGHRGSVTGASWSPEGRRIASVSLDGALKIWDAATVENLVTFPCEVPVHDLAWSPDGRRIACVCKDGTLRIWGSTDIEKAAKRATHLETGVLAAAVKYSHNDLGLALADQKKWDEADTAATADSQRLVGERQEQLGDAWFAIKRFEEAEQAYQRALATFERLEAGDPAKPIYRHKQVTTQSKLAYCMFTSGRCQNAAKHYPRFLELHEKSASEMAGNASYQNDAASALSWLGLALQKAGRTGEAEESFGKALALWKQLSDEDPTNEFHRSWRAHFSLALATLLRDANRVEDSLEPCRTSIRLNQQLVADFADKPVYRSRLGYARGVLISLLSSR